MLVHIVMWKLKDGVNGKTKAESAAMLKTALEALPSRIPEIESLSVGIQAFPDESAWDLVLHSVFDGHQELLAYQQHPDHQAVAALIGQLRTDRAVVDYLI